MLVRGVRRPSDAVVQVRARIAGRPELKGSPDVVVREPAWFRHSVFQSLDHRKPEVGALVCMNRCRSEQFGWERRPLV